MHSSLHPHRQAVFASVFPTSAVHPPRHYVQSKDKTGVTIDKVTATLRDDSRQALGVGDENLTFNVSSAASTGFFFYYPRCSPHSKLRGAGGDERAKRIVSCAKLASWRQLPYLRKTFGISKLEKVFATVIDRTIADFIQWSYTGAYENSVLEHLRFWVDNVLLPYVSGYLNTLKDRQVHLSIFDQTQVQQWHDLVMTRLATLRTAELFDIIVDWNVTAAAVDDLKHFTTNPATRSYVTTDFAEALTMRLLHPGAATIEILTVYISVIRAFRRLDPKGVLLERVARRIRRYLRDREDTIKVVVAGLLADLSSDPANHDPDVLHELAYELHQHSSSASKVKDTDLDFNNMEWQPDPVDAAPEYLKSKSTDVLDSLITLFDSKDTFIKELQVTLSDRLLQNKPDFDQEISVVEHLKIRFGDSALQGCEVMLRDVLDSRKVDQVIRQDQAMDQMDETSTLSDVQLHAKILSRLFWPSLHEQNFRVPIPVQHQQSLYEKGFENLKQSRKLTWLNAIGQVDVELQLEDRTFHDEVLPWQASVIYAFQEDGDAGSDKPATRTLAELASQLEMTPSLVQSACMFWSSRQILTESSRDCFTVLETLPTGPDLDNDKNNDNTAGTDSATISHQKDAAVAAAAAAAEAAAREAQESDRKQKMGLYHQFVVSMLTNQGAMPLPQIAMMLGIVVPGGFPFGNEELKEFLAGMVKEGVLEVVGPGARYKIVR